MPIDFSSPVNNIINIFQSKSCLSTALNRDIDELTTWMNEFIKLDIKETPLVENLDLTEYKKYPWFEKTLEDLLNSRTNDLQFSSPAIEAYILDETKNPRDYFSSQADALVFKHLLDTIAIAALIRLDQEDNLTSVAARELSHHIAAEVGGDSSNASIAGNLHELINSNREYQTGDFSLRDELIRIFYSKLSDDKIPFIDRYDMAGGIGSLLAMGSSYHSLLMNANDCIQKLNDKESSYEVDEKLVLDMAILANLIPEDNSCEAKELLEVFNKIIAALEYKNNSGLGEKLYFLAEDAVEILAPEED